MSPDALIQILTETIAGMPDGIPRGHLYAFLQPYGFPLDAFEKLEGVLLASGRVRRQGQLLFAEKEATR